MSKCKTALIGGVFVLAVLGLLVLNGCAMFQRQPTYVLTETETYYLIPPDTPFKAQLIKGGPLVEVRRTQPTYAVDSGYLAKLQEAANAEILEPR